uniref:Uncharacterized protein n=1 Tax=Anguilla anguilla TaxID=7936 RepID=A0A0E9WG53_ANGAN
MKSFLQSWINYSTDMEAASCHSYHQEFSQGFSRQTVTQVLI